MLPFNGKSAAIKSWVIRRKIVASLGAVILILIFGSVMVSGFINY